MSRYIARRLVLLVPVLLGISIIVFALIRVAPGGPGRALFGPAAPPEQIERFNQKYGLDKPVPVQYVIWLQGVVTGDLGQSLINSLPVTALIPSKLVPTTLVTLFAMLLSIPIGLVAGLIAALRRGRRTDRLSRFVFLLGLSMPSFWLGIILLVLFAVVLRWLPAGGYVPIEKDPIGSLRSLLLPAVTLAIPISAVLSRVVRTATLAAMDEEYVRTARSKGLPERIVIRRHMLRNVALPTVTTIGLQVGYLFGGAALIETVFTIPGVGRGLVDAVTNRDYAMVQGLTLVIALMTVLTALVVDLLYVYLDPRVRVG